MIYDVIELTVVLQSSDGANITINDSRITENHVVLLNTGVEAGNNQDELIGYITPTS